MQRLVVLAALVALIAGCSGSSAPVASSSLNAPTSSPTAAGTPAAMPPGPYGVLTTWPTPGSSVFPSTYAISVVARDGTVTATTTPNAPAALTCSAGGAPYLPPPVSTSNTRVYFMDPQAKLHSMTPDGKVTDLLMYPLFAPLPDVWATFSVSPDDREIAAAVVSYGGAAPTTNLYVAPIGQFPSYRLIYSETGPDTVWPVGWDAGHLVLAKITACPGESAPGYFADELHVVDPTTARRIATLGGGACGTVAGPPSAAGVLCETDAISYNAVDWQGNPTQINTWISGLPSKRAAYLSPDGSQIAVSQDGSTTLVWKGPSSARGTYALIACSWIDDTHLLAGGQSPAVGDISTGTVTKVQADGTCFGRIPGGL